MRLLFNILRRQFLHALQLLHIEGGDSLDDRDVDSFLRFDLKSEYGRALPPEDAWQMLRARIAEREQQQAVQAYHPAVPSSVTARAWQGWTYIPRLAQAAIAIVLFVLLKGVAPPLVQTPQDLAVAVLDTPTAVVATRNSDALPPQMLRAYQQERNVALAAAVRTSVPATVPAVNGPTETETDEALERRMTHFPRDARVGSSRVNPVEEAPQNNSIKPVSGPRNPE